jgi:hypothetical protein
MAGVEGTGRQGDSANPIAVMNQFTVENAIKREILSAFRFYYTGTRSNFEYQP